MFSQRIPLPFGKYKGYLVCDIPSAYLRMAIDKTDLFDDELDEIMEEEYRFRTRNKQHWSVEDGKSKKKNR